MRFAGVVLAAQRACDACAGVDTQHPTDRKMAYLPTLHRPTCAHVHCGCCGFHADAFCHSTTDLPTPSAPVPSLRPAGATVNVGIDPSKVVITKLKLDKDRKKILERKSKATADKGKGKFTEQEVAMSNVD